MGMTKKSIALTASTLRRLRANSAGSVFAAAAKTDPAELVRNRRKVLAVSAMLFFVIPIAALLVNFLLRAH